MILNDKFKLYNFGSGWSLRLSRYAEARSVPPLGTCWCLHPLVVKEVGDQFPPGLILWPSGGKSMLLPAPLDLHL